MKFAKVNEELEDRKTSKVDAYRKWARVPENEAIDKDNLNDWAVRKTCSTENCSKDQLMDALEESLLEEDTLGDAAQAREKLKDQADVVIEKSQIERELDRALDRNQEQIENDSRHFIQYINTKMY